jgi:hypothetical protein
MRPTRSTFPKNRVAAQKIARALAAGAPYDRVADAMICGIGSIEMQLRRARKGYVLSAHAADQFAAGLPLHDHRRRRGCLLRRAAWRSPSRRATAGPECHQHQIFRCFSYAGA